MILMSMETYYYGHQYADYLLSSLGGDDDVELVDCVIGSREASGLLLVCAADVGDDSVEDDVRMLGYRTEVLRQTHEERNLLGAVRSVACM